MYAFRLEGGEIIGLLASACPSPSRHTSGAFGNNLHSRFWELCEQECCHSNANECVVVVHPISCYSTASGHMEMVDIGLAYQIIAFAGMPMK